MFNEYFKAALDCCMNFSAMASYRLVFVRVCPLVHPPCLKTDFFWMNGRWKEFHNWQSRSVMKRSHRSSKHYQHSFKWFSGGKCDLTITWLPTEGKVCREMLIFYDSSLSDSLKVRLTWEISCRGQIQLSITVSSVVSEQHSQRRRNDQWCLCDSSERKWRHSVHLRELRSSSAVQQPTPPPTLKPSLGDAIALNMWNQYSTTLATLLWGEAWIYDWEGERVLCYGAREKITCTRATPVPASWGNTYLILGAIRLGQGHSIPIGSVLCQNQYLKKITYSVSRQ